MPFVHKTKDYIHFANADDQQYLQRECPVDRELDSWCMQCKYKFIA